MALEAALEAYRNEEADVSWLPRAEGARTAQNGSCSICSIGIQDMKHEFGGKEIHYRYLPFVPNQINCCESPGFDVLSYNFTGCIMAIFTDSKGVRKVCHVSTGSDADCKAQWEDIQKQSTEVRNYRPSDYIRLPDMPGWAFLGCYGLITPDLKCYAITIGQPPGKTAGRYVAAIELCNELVLRRGPGEYIQQTAQGERVSALTAPTSYANATANTPTLAAATTDIATTT